MKHNGMNQFAPRTGFSYDKPVSPVKPLKNNNFSGKNIFWPLSEKEAERLEKYKKIPFSIYDEIKSSIALLKTIKRI